MKNGKSWQINPPALLLYLKIPSPASAFQKLQDHIPFLYFPTRAVPDPPSTFSPAVLPSVFRLPPFRQKLKSHRESSRLQENALTPHPAFLRPHKPQTDCQNKPAPLRNKYPESEEGAAAVLPLSCLPISISL